MKFSTAMSHRFQAEDVGGFLVSITQKSSSLPNGVSRMLIRSVTWPKIISQRTTAMLICWKYVSYILSPVASLKAIRTDMSSTAEITSRHCYVTWTRLPFTFSMKIWPAKQRRRAYALFLIHLDLPVLFLLLTSLNLSFCVTPSHVFRTFLLCSATVQSLQIVPFHLCFSLSPRLRVVSHSLLHPLTLFHRLPLHKGLLRLSIGFLVILTTFLQGFQVIFYPCHLNT